ncbi:MAG TPA: TonB-dependent receptor, partial [Bryobacteraceae bacterium]
FRDNQESGNVNATYLSGKHSFRFGGEYTHFALNHFQPQGTYGPRGGFQFTGAVTSLKGGAATNMYNSLADFMLGLPQNFGKATQIENPNALRFSSFAFYGQDQFQATQHLTLTYGIRYEYYPFASRDHFGAFRYDPASGNVFIGGRGGVPNDTGESVGWGMLVPRLGINYRLDDKSVIRTGFGMTVDPDNFRYLRDSYPAVILQQFNGNSSYNPAGCLNSGSYAPLGGCKTFGIPQATLPDLNAGVLPLPSTVTTNTVPQNFRRGYLYSYNLAYQRELPAHFISTITYVGTREVRAVSPININASPVGTGAAGRPLNIAHGQSADIYSMLPFGSMNYNGLQAQLTNRVNRNAQAGVVYTWSHAFDISDNSTYGTVIFGDPAFYSRNYATAGYDRTNNLQIWAVLTSPFGKGQHWGTGRVTSWLLGGWRLNTTTSKVSGTPMTITAAGTSLNAPGSTQVADQVKPQVAIYGAHAPKHIYFDTAAFAPVTAVRYGTASRNSIRGPGYFRLDAGLFRSVPIWHEANFRFGVEAFDLTNTPLFNNPGTNVSGGGFGQISTAFFNRTMRLSGRIQF